MGFFRFGILTIVVLTLTGCPHSSDPDDASLVGKYEAIDPKMTILGSRHLDIVDAHRIKTDGGKVFRYSVSDEFFILDRAGDEDLIYSPNPTGHPGEIRFQHAGTASSPSKEIDYRRLP